MKTNIARSAALLAALLLAASSSGYAGAGPQYWANVGRSTTKIEKGKPVSICPGSKEFPITAMKPAGHNARGPLVPVKVGTKRVCTVCPVSGVRTKGWANGRGPQKSIRTTRTGVPHTCDSHCPPART